MTKIPDNCLPIVRYIRKNVPKPNLFLEGLSWPLIVSDIPMSEVTDEAERAFMNWARKTDPQDAIDLIWRAEG